MPKKKESGRQNKIRTKNFILYIELINQESCFTSSIIL